MVQIIKQPKHTTEIITKEGEVKILLEITININSNSIQVDTINQSEKKQEDDVRWAIPSFKSENKIKFGKKVEE